MKKIYILVCIAILLSGIKVFSQNPNFTTKITCDSSYKPGETCELVFTFSPNPGVVNQYDRVSTNYVGIQLPFGITVISSSAEFFDDGVLAQNPVNNNTISWGSLSGSDYASFVSPVSVTVTVSCHQLLEGMQEANVAISTIYYEYNSVTENKTVEISQYSPVNVKLHNAYITTTRNLSIGLMNIGDTDFSDFTITYSFDNGEEHIYSGTFNFAVGTYFPISIPVSDLLPASGEVLTKIRVDVDGDISSNNNIFDGVIKFGTALHQNYYGSDFVYGLPSFLMMGLDSNEDEFISADDFTVPEGQSWNIRQVVCYGILKGDILPDRYAVRVYLDDNGKPGETLFYDELNTLQNNRVDHLSINLEEPLNVPSGRYWLAVYGIFDTVTTPETNYWSWRYTEDTGDDSFMYESEIIYYTQQDWTSFMDLSQTGTIFSFYGEIATNILSVSKKEISVYPDPAQDYISINTDLPASYIIYDITGRVVSEGNLCEKTDVSDLCSGKYFIKIITETGISESQFIKTK